MTILEKKSMPSSVVTHHLSSTDIAYTANTTSAPAHGLYIVSWSIYSIMVYIYYHGLYIVSSQQHEHRLLSHPLCRLGHHHLSAITS